MLVLAYRWSHKESHTLRAYQEGNLNSDHNPVINYLVCVQSVGKVVLIQLLMFTKDESIL